MLPLPRFRLKPWLHGSREGWGECGKLVHVCKAEVGCQLGSGATCLWDAPVLRVQQAWASSQAKDGGPRPTCLQGPPGSAHDPRWQRLRQLSFVRTFRQNGRKGCSPQAGPAWQPPQTGPAGRRGSSAGGSPSAAGGCTRVPPALGAAPRLPGAGPHSPPRCQSRGRTHRRWRGGPPAAGQERWKAQLLLQYLGRQAADAQGEEIGDDVAGCQLHE